MYAQVIQLGIVREYNDKKPQKLGSHVDLKKVYKSGYEVFNTDTVEL